MNNDAVPQLLAACDAAEVLIRDIERQIDQNLPLNPYRPRPKSQAEIITRRILSQLSDLRGCAQTLAEPAAAASAAEEEPNLGTIIRKKRQVQDELVNRAAREARDFIQQAQK